MFQRKDVPMNFTTHDDLNQVRLCGEVGQELEIKSSRNGNPYVRLTITTRKSPHPQGEGETPRTQWLQVYAFGAQAADLAGILEKGCRILVEGHLEKQWVHADRVTVLKKQNEA